MFFVSNSTQKPRPSHQTRADLATHRVHLLLRPPDVVQAVPTHLLVHRVCALQPVSLRPAAHIVIDGLTDVFQIARVWDGQRHLLGTVFGWNQSRIDHVHQPAPRNRWVLGFASVEKQRYVRILHVGDLQVENASPRLRLRVHTPMNNSSGHPVVLKQ